MEWTGLNELREKFLSFFESRGHTRLESAPLIPRDEASLLLINSGMAPLKKYFTRQKFLPDGSFRATSCQKCIRTPDIENVGKTARHGTFFEMLGNFSFGDYFKEDATRWAWEFLTEVLGMPKERLYVSVFEDDDEAYSIWTERRGVPEDHMVRFGREDNFWEIGSGPCGPCSEIYFDRGPEKGCGRPDCRPGCECDRFIEIWNLVFTQFSSDGAGHYTPLEHRNIDTGMGLERLACVIQNVNNLFEVDTVRNIISAICGTAGCRYGEDEKTDVSVRVITDHIRSTVFLAADGVTPQNEGRGYVLRRLIRRAARHGRLLGIRGPFLHTAAKTVIHENRNAYPELVQRQDYILETIRMEEERFAQTLEAGLKQVRDLIADLQRRRERVFPGDEAFRLHDTYGFPLDLTRELCGEHGMDVDEAGYRRQMEIQRNRAREATRTHVGDAAWKEDALKDVRGGDSFIGYRRLNADTGILAMMKENAVTDTLESGDRGQIVLLETPFYAEMGGQVGDTGLIVNGESTFTVTDTRKSASGHILHVGRVTSGSFRRGDGVLASVDAERRAGIQRNHTACHLLQAALRETLGEHVHQAGSMVDDRVCRFDFTHPSAMTGEEIRRVEERVNERILEADPVTVTEMPLEEARKLGAMALFGEKYGETVRVVDVNGKSVEFCGGCHVDDTSKIGLFKIVKESSVAAGIRRIEAVTGRGVLARMEDIQRLLEETASSLRLSSPAELPAKTAQMANELREREKHIRELEDRLAASKAAGLFRDAEKIGPVTVASAFIPDVRPDDLRRILDDAKASRADAVIALAGVFNGKGAITVGCGSEAVKAGAHAGKLVRELCARTGGAGGGRPDGAMGGVGDPAKTEEALAALPELVKSQIG